MQMITGLLIALIGIWLPGQQPQPAQPQDCKSIRVALLPVVNRSGEKDEKQRDLQRAAGDEALKKEFEARGFTIVDTATIQKALAELKVDIEDEEQWRRENLFKVGREVGADYVIFAAIMHVEQHLRVNLLTSSREGKAQVKFWLLDVKNEKPMLSSAVREGKSGGGFFAGLDVGSKRIIIAIGNAIRDHLKDFMKPYPMPKNPK